MSQKRKRQPATDDRSLKAIALQAVDATGEIHSAAEILRKRIPGSHQQLTGFILEAVREREAQNRPAYA